MEHKWLFIILSTSCTGTDHSCAGYKNTDYINDNNTCYTTNSINTCYTDCIDSTWYTDCISTDTAGNYADISPTASAPAAGSGLKNSASSI
jgi:hypothetical protein